MSPLLCLSLVVFVVLADGAAINPPQSPGAQKPPAEEWQNDRGFVRYKFKLSEDAVPVARQRAIKANYDECMDVAKSAERIKTGNDRAKPNPAHALKCKQTADQLTFNTGALEKLDVAVESFNLFMGTVLERAAAIDPNGNKASTGKADAALRVVHAVPSALDAYYGSLPGLLNLGPTDLSGFTLTPVPSGIERDRVFGATQDWLAKNRARFLKALQAARDTIKDVQYENPNLLERQLDMQYMLLPWVTNAEGYRVFDSSDPQAAQFPFETSRDQARADSIIQKLVAAPGAVDTPQPPVHTATGAVAASAGPSASPKKAKPTLRFL